MFKALALAATISVSALAAQANTFEFNGTVFGTDAIYGAGLAGGGSAVSTAPQSLSFTAGTGSVLSAGSITGTVTCCGPSALIGPDGSIGGTNITAFNGISGIMANAQMFLAGVFIDSTNLPASGLEPATLNYSSGTGPLTTDTSFASILLNQAFFIGDGLGSGGVGQTWIVPETADTLLLGFVDGFAFSGTPGYYDDNQGSFSVEMTVTTAMANVPLPASLPLLLAGIGAFGLFRRKS